jgi:hypothetical protein
LEEVEGDNEDKKKRKRDIISAAIGSVVAVIIWIVLLGPTFH